MQLWTPPSHRVFMSHSSVVKATPATNALFGVFFLALDRLQQLEVVAMVDPAAVECVLRHWTLGNSCSLNSLIIWGKKFRKVWRLP